MTNYRCPAHPDEHSDPAAPDATEGSEKDLGLLADESLEDDQ